MPTPSSDLPAGAPPPPGPTWPVLVGCGHGTRDAAGRRAVALLRLDVGARRPGLQVLAASIDVQKPELPDVVGRLTATGTRCVVVPLLLSAGYHVYTDVAQAVASSGGLAVAAGALGPADTLVGVLLDRLREKGFDGSGRIVLGAAGSSDRRAVADVATVAAALATVAGVPVTAGYLSAAEPSAAVAVAQACATADPSTVWVANYLLSPGFFADRLARLGAEPLGGSPAVRVTAPLAPHPALADLVLARYDAALAAAGWTPTAAGAG